MDDFVLLSLQSANGTKKFVAKYVLVFYDQQEDNPTDFNSIYIDLTQYLKFFDCFCYCRFLKFHEPFIYTTLISLLVKKNYVQCNIISEMFLKFETPLL